MTLLEATLNTMPYNSMPNGARNTYQRSEILDAAPTRLIILLYRGAIEAVVKARAHLLAGERRERAAQITKAFEIIVELAGAVDRSQPGPTDPNGKTGDEFALRLLQLYDYMQQQLNRANVDQIAEPLDEVERLLGNLLEGWEAAHAQLAAVPAVSAQMAPSGYAQSERKTISYSA